MTVLTWTKAFVCCALVLGAALLGIRFDEEED